MTNSEDRPEDVTLTDLNEQTLRLLGKRLFAEARQQGESEDAAFDARVRERRHSTFTPGSDADSGWGGDGSDSSSSD